MMVMEQLPLTRASDPDTSHQAAKRAKPGSEAMNVAILTCSSRWSALTAFDIARRVLEQHPHRWDEGSVRTAVSRLGKVGRLVKDGKGKSPRKQPCDRWRLP